MVLWLYVTKDKYEFPIYICDTAKELAEKVGGSTTTNSIYSAIRHARERGYFCRYKRVEIGEEDADI